VVAYVEAMMSEYGMSKHHVMNELPLRAGLALCEARNQRVNPSGGPSYVDRSAIRARRAEEARIAAEFEIIENGEVAA
jgi:hypothetical protein